jgi:S-adenosylmethionine hydrolase
MPIVALATDFGEGLYVGQMKAVILSRAPAVRIVDLFHSVSPQCVLEGSFLLSSAWRFFPAGTIYVCVVDPGVGSARRILAVRAHRQTFLAPDNGLLSFLRDADMEDKRVVENRKFFMEPVSNTFHGRDIFSPVAAALATGTALAKLGRPAGRIERLDGLRPRRVRGGIEGTIVHVDHFGNAVTNLPVGGRPRLAPVLKAGRRRFASAVRTYADAPGARPVVLCGSFDTWEIAVRNGDAASRLGLKVGMRVRQEAGWRKI